MIEVFKTNVRDHIQAKMVLSMIHNVFTHYKANFDLDDRDNILRIASHTGQIEVPTLVDLLNRCGIQAEVLPD
jgi:L-asparaginase II